MKYQCMDTHPAYHLSMNLTIILVLIMLRYQCSIDKINGKIYCGLLIKNGKHILLIIDKISNNHIF